MDELAAAFMAKLVSGNLQQVDEATTHRSATDGRANKINVDGFIGNVQRSQIPIQQQVTVQGASNSVVTQMVQDQSVSDREISYKQKSSKMSVRSSETFNEDELLSAIKSIDKTLKNISTSLKKLIEIK